MFLRTAYFLFHGQKGGVEHQKAWWWNIHTFLELFYFPLFAHYYSDSIMTIQKNPGRR